MRVRTHVRAHVLGRVRVLGLVPAHVLVLHGIPGGAILTSLPGLEGTVGGVEVGLGPEGVEEEVGAVDSVKLLGLVLHHVAGALGLCGDGRQATSVAGTEGADRGRRHILCVPAGHGRDLTRVPVPALHVLVRGRARCLIPPTRGTVGAGAGVAPVHDPRVVEGGATAKTTSETAVVDRSHRGINCSYPFLRIRFDHLSRATSHSYSSTFVTLKCTICKTFNLRVQRKDTNGRGGMKWYTVAGAKKGVDKRRNQSRVQNSNMISEHERKRRSKKGGDCVQNTDT